MEELNETLKVVERELNFAKKAYNSILYLYWAAAFPAIYVLSSVIAAYTGTSVDSSVVLLSASAVLIFAVEESKASKKVEEIETVLGRKTRLDVKYVLAQVLVWPLVIVTAGLMTNDVWFSLLVSIGAGMLALAAVDYAFRRGGWDKVVIGAMTLVLSVPYDRVPMTKGAYTTLVLSMAFATGAYLTLRKAMRE